MEADKPCECAGREGDVWYCEGSGAVNERWGGEIAETSQQKEEIIGFARICRQIYARL